MSLQSSDRQQAFSPSALKGVQVLLVEDEPDIAELFNFVLEQAGATVFYMPWARDALQILERQHPHILVSNLSLPDEDGFWLIRQIRVETSLLHLPAIAVTSYSREFDEVQAIENGFQRFINKPIDSEELVSSIMQLVERAN